MNSEYDLNMYIEDNWSQRAHLQVPLRALLKFSLTGQEKGDLLLQVTA
jgi:hypothetical protein